MTLKETFVQSSKLITINTNTSLHNVLHTLSGAHDGKKGLDKITYELYLIYKIYNI